MSTPSFDDIKSSTEKAVGFIEWTAEVLRGKNWVTKLLLLDVVIFAVFNPPFFPKILKLFMTEPKLPGKYTLYFWFIIGIIFTIALIVAPLTKPRKAEEPAIDLSRRSAIKGLRHYGFEDAEIFAKLQREQSIRECFESITSPDFRFGVLCGESGCGKTSFLQAGLIPRLKEQYQCVYVKFTDLDPLDSIRQALIEQAQLPQTTSESEQAQLPHSSAASDALLSQLEAVVQANDKPLALFFDQFEQFFVHHKLKEQREPFIQAMARWYNHRAPLSVKIIVSVRGDFKYRLDELQKAMRYSLGFQDSFTLDKFTPHEAAEIFHVIAESEGIAYDTDFVEELARQELAREDGLISPVDIQILAWMIRGQKTADERAFNRHAFQQLGGIEGLLERFLSRVLEVRETEERRQTAIKVLLALTDLERNVRAGVLTVESLQKKLAGSISDSEITETVPWLARGDVRLITPSKLEGKLGYELAHERLIPALRKMAGKELSQADQTNQLLNRRVNEWLGNQQAPRYLLSWRELRQIKKQKPYVVWGQQRDQKEDLILQSKKRWLLRTIAVCFIILVVATIMGWWYSPWGQIWQTKRDFFKLIQKVDDTTRSEIVKTFSQVRDFQRALSVAISISKSDEKAIAFGNIAESMAKIAIAKQDSTMLSQALIVADSIQKSDDKSNVLYNIIESLTEIAITKKDNGMLSQALTVAKAMPNPDRKVGAFLIIAESMMKIGDTKKASGLLSQVFKVADGIPNPVAKVDALLNIAESMIKIGDNNRVSTILAQALIVVEDIPIPVDKTSVLLKIARLRAKINDASKVKKLLLQTLRIADGIKNPDDKASALNNIAESMAIIGDTNLASELLSKALTVANGIIDPIGKANALQSIAESLAEIAMVKQDSSLLSKVIKIANEITNPHYKAIALRNIAELMAESAITKNDSIQLSQAFNIVATIPNPNSEAEALREIFKSMHMDVSIKSPNSKSCTLGNIAESMAEIAIVKQDSRLFSQALKIADGIQHPDSKAKSYRNIAELLMKNDEDKRVFVLLSQALTAANSIDDPYDKAEALYNITDLTIKIDDANQTNALLSQAHTIANLITDPFYKVNALHNISQSMMTLGYTEQANVLLSEMLIILDGIIDPEDKADALIKISESMVKFGDAKQASALLSRAFRIVNEIKDPYDKTDALNQIIVLLTKMGKWRQARKGAEMNATDAGKSKALLSILQIWSKKKNPLLKEEQTEE